MRFPGERDKVDALIAEVPDHLWQEGQAVGVPDFETVDDVEATQVLACDLAVGTDVDDVDALAGVPQVLDGPGDDSLGDHGLAEAYLIGDEEPLHLVLGKPEPVEDIVDGCPLEVLEAGQHALCVGCVALHARRSW